MFNKPQLRPFFTIRNRPQRADITCQISDVSICHVDIIVSEYELASVAPKNEKIRQIMRKNNSLLIMLPGTVQLTPAFDLRAKNLLHVACTSLKIFELSSIAEMYVKALQLAAPLAPTTMAFPIIAETPDNILRATQAAMALDAIYRNSHKIKSLQRVYICVPSEQALKTYIEAARCLAPTRIVPV
jgi:O-acetyl-ADP-ribose deacetylase (regulator of RNase III)